MKQLALEEQCSWRRIIYTTSMTYLLYFRSSLKSASLMSDLYVYFHANCQMTGIIPFE